MSESAKIDLIHRFCRTWGSPDVPKLLDFFADDARHQNMPGAPAPGKDGAGV